MQMVTVDTTLSVPNVICICDATNNNVTVTLQLMTSNRQYYCLTRYDNGQNIVSVVLQGGATLSTGESTFRLYGMSNVTIVSYGNKWIPILGYTKDR